MPILGFSTNVPRGTSVENCRELTVAWPAVRYASCMKRRIRLLLAVLVVAVCAAAQTDNPVADPKAIIVSGQARFTVLTPQLIRMEWSESGKFEDHASLVFIN